MKKTATLWATLSCCLLPLWAISMNVAANESEQRSIPQGAYFRHVSEDGVTHWNTVLTQEAIRLGYQLLDAQGRILEDVPAVTAADIEARARAKAEAEQAEKDKEMLRLYSSPADAIRARDRRIKAMQLKISYEKNTLSQLQHKLDGEISAASRSERSGKAVPEAVEEAIARYQRQIEASNQMITDLETEITAVETEYAPIIERLEDIQARRGG